MLYNVNILVAIVIDFKNLVLSNSQTINIFIIHSMRKLFEIKFLTAFPLYVLYWGIWGQQSGLWGHNWDTVGISNRKDGIKITAVFTLNKSKGR